MPDSRTPRRARLPLALAAVFFAAALAAPALSAPHAPATAAASQAAPAAKTFAASIEKARELVQTHREELGIPGISAAVGVDGKIVWSEGFGFADLENRGPARAETLYRIGSVSKPVTAVAVVQLATAGALDLDTEVQQYVPSFPEKRWPITTRQLGGHIAGVRHYNPGESIGAGQHHYDDVVDGLAIFKDDPLLFEPGTDYSYSSYGWNLISAVVQGAADQPFLQYMQEKVFDPLGMNETYADDPRWIIPDRTRFYGTLSDGRVVNAPFVDNSYKWAGGGFISSVEDLVRFGSAHLEPGFLSQQALDLLFTSQRTSDGEETGYGIGWRVLTFGELFPENSDMRSSPMARLAVMQHGGSSVGGRAILLLIPEERMVVAALVNFSRFGGGRLAGQIAAAFLERGAERRDQ